MIVDLNPKTEGHNFDGFPKQRDKISLAQLHADFFGAVGSDLCNLSADSSADSSAVLSADLCDVSDVASGTTSGSICVDLSAGL